MKLTRINTCKHLLKKNKSFSAQNLFSPSHPLPTVTDKRDRVNSGETPALTATPDSLTGGCSSVATSPAARLSPADSPLPRASTGGDG